MKSAIMGVISAFLRSCRVDAAIAVTPRVEPSAVVSDVLDDDDLLLECLMRVSDARALVECGRVNKRWRALAHSDQVWRPVCADRWAGKHVPWSKLAELPTWWERYARAEELAAVDKLTDEDIVELVFIFSINLRPCRLAIEDGSRVFVADWITRLPWRWNADGSLQVAEYPRHTVSRLPNWGWQTANMFVTLTSLPEEPHSLLVQELSNESSRQLCTLDSGADALRGRDRAALAPRPAMMIVTVPRLLPTLERSRPQS